MRFRSLGSVNFPSGLWGTGGHGLCGCLLIKRFHVSTLFGATSFGKPFHIGHLVPMKCRIDLFLRGVYFGTIGT